MAQEGSGDGMHSQARAIERAIVTVRGKRVLLGQDIARLYGVSHGSLLQAVKRNQLRFPQDFIFQLTNQEVAALKSQFVISNPRPGRGGRRHRPYAFTEQGVAMLSSVLRSDRAIAVNIEIMRAFVRLRRATVISSQLMKLVNELARRVDTHDEAIKSLIETISEMIESPARRKRPIGFTADIRS